MLLKFIDRVKEVESLERAARSKRAEFYIIYGRRRVGKTELVKHFMKNQNHFYFLAKEQNLQLEFERFKDKFSRKFDVYIEGDDWESLFSNITKKISGRLVIVIDEFSYWMAKDRAILTEFQHLWDELLAGEDVFLILMGSYVSMMETELMGQKSPLYGRRTGQLLVEPMPITSLHEFLPGYSISDIIRAYGCLDTVPYYLSQFNPEVDFWENVLDTFLNRTNPLHQDVEILLSSELREPNVYLNIIRAILEGATKLSEIAGSARVDITNLPKYLNTLVKLRIIRKTLPIVSPKEKRAVYELTDNYFRFSLTYVIPYREEIVTDPDSHLSYIREKYPQYLGPTFERFCMEALRALRPVPFNRVGKWWFKGEEVDVVALDDKGKGALFCECKWKDNVGAPQVLRDLRRKSEIVGEHWRWKKAEYAIFARSFKERSDETDLMLYDLKDLAHRLYGDALLDE